jgi:hypothetical protein
MGALVTFLIQIAILGAVLALALAAGVALARVLGNRTAAAVAAGAVATTALAVGLWLLAHDRLQRVDTDEVAVATLVTSVVGALWLAGLATGYALARPRP